MSAVKEAPRVKGPSGAEQGTEMKTSAGAEALNKAPVTPFTFIGRIADEMDRFFEEFGLEAGWPWPRLLARGHERVGLRGRAVPAEWMPRIEAFEREGRFVVRVELPGMTPEDVKVEVGKGHLMLQGERKQEHHEEREGRYYGECRYGAFHRVIPLPEGVDTGGATAELRKGVLEVVMPKKAPPEAEARRLEVREAH